MEKQNENQDQGNNQTNWIPIFMCLGIGIGSLYGMLTDNTAIGLSLGLSLGLALGSIMNRMHRYNQD